MKRFLHAHATHPQAAMALALAAAQIEAQRQAERPPLRPTLGWIYLSDHYAAEAEALLDDLRTRWPDVAWVGAVGVGVAANGVEYFGEPALALMLGEVPPDQFRLFSGTRPLTPAQAGGFAAETALVHADPATPELDELVAELAERTRTGYLFGGLSSARTRCLHIADGVFQGGLSGVAFGPDVELLSRVTQGCQPVGPARRIDQVERNLVLQLDGRPALDCLLADLGLETLEPRAALPRLRQTLVGLSDPGGDAAARPGAFGTDTRVRHLIGLDPARHAIAVADEPAVGMRLAFCRRDTEAARRDLVRICAELREELAPDGDAPPREVAGAIYVSCSGRGGPHFGAPSAELALVRHALGDVPLIGFFAAGEVARHHLYGYTGVLTLFPR